jgi:Tol biopolymer transport system component
MEPFGVPRVVDTGPGHLDGPEWSPDGRWIYFNTEGFSDADGHAQIARMRRDGSGLTQLTFDDRVNWFPHVSPDAKWVVYLSFPPGTSGHPANLDIILYDHAP